MTVCRVLESGGGLVQVKVLDNGHLCWSQLHLSYKATYLSSDVKSIPAEDILHVRVKPRKRKLSEECGPRTHMVLVHHAIRNAKKQLRMGTYVLFGTQVECQTLAHDINSKRKDKAVASERRQLLVVINPISGKGRGMAAFRNSVEPLFRACDIDVQSIVTSRSGQIAQMMKNHDLQGYDGIVIMGGDGSYNEAISGLLIRHMTEAKRDVNDSGSDFIPTSVPLGFIPTGSGNWLPLHLYGNDDVVTATIHVIKGRTVLTNAISTHEPDRLLGFACVVHHIGLIGDLIRQCELNRWMGPARYAVIPHASILKRRLLSADLTLYFANDNDASRCEASTSDGGKRPPEDHISHGNQKATDVRRSDGGKGSAGISTSGFDVITTDISNSDAEKIATDISTKVGEDSLVDVSNSDAEKIATDVSKKVGEDSLVDVSNSDAEKIATDVSTKVGEDSLVDVSNSDAEKIATDVSTKVGEDSLVDVSNSDVGKKATDVSTSQGGKRQAEINGRCSEAGKRVESERIGIGPDFSWEDKTNTEQMTVDVYNLCVSISRILSQAGIFVPTVGSESATMQLVGKCSLGDFVKHLTRVRDNSPGMNDFTFVKCRQVRAMQLTLSNKKSKEQTWYINNDGECITLTADTYYLRLHPRVLCVFGSCDP